MENWARRAETIATQIKNDFALLSTTCLEERRYFDVVVTNHALTAFFHILFLMESYDRLFTTCPLCDSVVYTGKGEKVKLCKQSYREFQSQLLAGQSITYPIKFPPFLPWSIKKNFLETGFQLFMLNGNNISPISLFINRIMLSFRICSFCFKKVMVHKLFRIYNRQAVFSYTFIWYGMSSRILV